jgi:hypothetical protein
LRGRTAGELPHPVLRCGLPRLRSFRSLFSVRLLRERATPSIVQQLSWSASYPAAGHMIGWGTVVSAPRDEFILRRFASGWAWAAAPGDQGAWTFCNSEIDGTFLFCSQIEDVRIDMRRLRFQVIYPLGYAWGPDAVNGVDGHGMPSLEIGTCKPSN